MFPHSVFPGSVFPGSVFPPGDGGSTPTPLPWPYSILPTKYVSRGDKQGTKLAPPVPLQIPVMDDDPLTHLAAARRKRIAANNDTIIRLVTRFLNEDGDG